MDTKITVRIDSSRPIFIEADTDSFGQIFAGMSDEEQVNVLRSIVEHMKPHRIQWDYIAIALEKDENRQVRDDLSVIFPSQHELLSALAAKDAEIDLLKDALRPFADIADLMDSETEGFSMTDCLQLVVQNEGFPTVNVNSFCLQRFYTARDLIAGGSDA